MSNKNASPFIDEAYNYMVMLFVLTSESRWGHAGLLLEEMIEVSRFFKPQAVTDL
jgi:hypothetical protein